MRGRKPKPTVIKELQGNPGRRPLPTNEPKFTSGIGDVPGWLDARAREVWELVASELGGLGMLQRVDSASLASYCQAVSMAEKAQGEVDEYGLTLSKSDQNGNELRYKNPAVGILKDSMLLIQKFASEFGITPASRGRVKAPEAKKEDDPLEEFLGPTIAGKIGA
jgi:P27 family predicted phage terminase small subunit